MAGDARVRHCTLCDLNVYNLSEMTRAEVPDLIARTEGRLCARLYRRADGTLLTRDCPTGLQRMRTRIAQWKSAVMAAVLSVSAFATGCATSAKPQPSTGRASAPILEQPPVIPQESFLGGTIVDEGGVCLPGVLVVVREEATGREHVVATDGEGRFTARVLATEGYSIELPPTVSSGAVIRDLQLKQCDVATAHAPTVDFSITVGIVVSGEEGVMGSGFGTSTKFTKWLMDRLPVF
jgi:hypothetical protein